MEFISIKFPALRVAVAADRFELIQVFASLLLLGEALKVFAYELVEAFPHSSSDLSRFGYGFFIDGQGDVHGTVSVGTGYV